MRIQRLKRVGRFAHLAIDAKTRVGTANAIPAAVGTIPGAA